MFVLRAVGVIELSSLEAQNKGEREEENKREKERKSDFSQQAQFQHGNLMPLDI